jgi:hypothetical protein
MQKMKYNAPTFNSEFCAGFFDVACSDGKEIHSCANVVQVDSA